LISEALGEVLLSIDELEGESSESVKFGFIMRKGLGNVVEHTMGFEVVVSAGIVFRGFLHNDVETITFFGGFDEFLVAEGVGVGGEGRDKLARCCRIGGEGRLGGDKGGRLGVKK
jgi:hypothetical protein